MTAGEVTAGISTGIALILVLVSFELLTIREERRYAEALAAGDVDRAEYHARRAQIFAIFCRRKGSPMPKTGKGI